MMLTNVLFTGMKMVIGFSIEQLDNNFLSTEISKFGIYTII